MPALNIDRDFDFDTGQWKQAAGAPAGGDAQVHVHGAPPAQPPPPPPPSQPPALSHPQRLVMEELLSELETRAMERPHGGFRLFVERAWPLVDPAPFVPGLHIDAICAFMEALARGEFKDGLLTLPPRFGKSLLITVLFPAWVWGPLNRPSTKWMFNTYRLDLSLRDSGKRRLLMSHAWYLRRWGARFTLGAERFRADTASRYENNKGGFHVATSVGGGNIGEGADFVFADDVNDLNEIHSEVARENVNRWWNEIMATRLNTAASVRFIVQQRGHTRDLAGIVLEQGGYEHLCLPNEFDPARRCVTRWFIDPRTLPGELLCEARLNREQTEERKRSLGEMAYAHQFQQLAVPAGGGIWKRAWFRYWVPRFHPLVGKLDDNGHTIVALPPTFDRRIHTWDMTFKKTAGGSYVSGMAWGKRQAAAYLLGVFRERVGFVDTLQAVRDLLRAHPANAVYVEGKANGPAVIDVLRLEIPGLIESKTERGKEEYAHAASPHVEAGNYVLPHPSLYPWVAPMISRITMFPAAQFDDEVDTITQADRQLFIQQPFDARRFAQGSDHGI